MDQEVWYEIEVSHRDDLTDWNRYGNGTYDSVATLSDAQGQMVFRLRELAKAEIPDDAYAILDAVNNVAIALEREISYRKHEEAKYMVTFIRATGKEQFK